MDIVFLSREEKVLLRLRKVIFEKKPKAVTPKVKRIASTRDPWFVLNIKFKAAGLAPATAAATVTSYIAASLDSGRSGPHVGPADEIGLVLKTSLQTHSVRIMAGAIPDAQQLLEHAFLQLARGLGDKVPPIPEADPAIEL